jgi:hypothetical protein
VTVWFRGLDALHTLSCGSSNNGLIVAFGRPDLKVPLDWFLSQLNDVHFIIPRSSQLDEVDMFFFSA